MNSSVVRTEAHRTRNISAYKEKHVDIKLTEIIVPDKALSLQTLDAWLLDVAKTSARSHNLARDTKGRPLSGFFLSPAKSNRVDVRGNSFQWGRAHFYRVGLRIATYGAVATAPAMLGHGFRHPLLNWRNRMLDGASGNSGDTVRSVMDCQKLIDFATEGHRPLIEVTFNTTNSYPHTPEGAARIVQTHAIQAGFETKITKRGPRHNVGSHDMEQWTVVLGLNQPLKDIFDLQAVGHAWESLLIHWVPSREFRGIRALPKVHELAKDIRCQLNLEANITPLQVYEKYARVSWKTTRDIALTHLCLGYPLESTAAGLF